MGANSSIEWTHHTFNPWWGCTRVSPGCQHCYAETFAKRVGQKVWGADAERRFFGAKHWAEPIKWNAAAEKAGERQRVFCASMADVFEIPSSIDVANKMREARQQLAALIHATPSLDWLLLTKRPQNVLEVFPTWWFRERRNVWIGATIEDQRRADERIPELLKIPAHVRFLSCEPLLEGIDIAKHRPGALGIHWVIVGGESGHGARPCHAWWVRNIVGQCRDADVAPFVKQLGAKPRFDQPGVVQDFSPFRDAKGGDWTEWPDDLRVRELPTVQ